jgi:hypothetical protein
MWTSSSSFSGKGNGRTATAVVDDPRAPKDAHSIHREVRNLAGMISNIWGWNCSRTLYSDTSVPDQIRVHDGYGGAVVLPGFLLQSMEKAVQSRQRSDQRSLMGGVAVTNVQIQEVFLRQSTIYLTHIAVLLKLRWLLRLHSACSELNYKVIGMKEVIFHLQHLILQEKAEAHADSIFQTKYSGHVGSHLSLDAVIADIFDQLKGSLGGSWRGFCEFVASCHPRFAVHSSNMDTGWKHVKDDPPQVVSNDNLAVTVDTIFLTHFLRKTNADDGTLSGLNQDLDSLGIPPLELPALHGARHLLNFGKRKLGLLTQDERGTIRELGDKALEKLAQSDAVLLLSALELRSPEVILRPGDYLEEESDDDERDLGPTQESAPVLRSMLSGVEDQNDTGVSAQASFTTKPPVKPSLFNAAVIAVRFSNVFPQGIRNRLFKVLSEEYGLTRKQARKLRKAPGQETDGRRLTASQMIELQAKEKERLMHHSVATGRSTFFLRSPPLAMCPSEDGNPAKYTTWKETQVPRVRSEPSLKTAGDMLANSRPPWKTWKGAPLGVDPETKQLNSTGYFMKFAPLDPTP